MMFLSGQLGGEAGDDLGDAVSLGQAHEGVDVRALLEEFFLVVLGEASGDDDGVGEALFFCMEGVVDGFEGFVAGGFDEAAGVDDGDVGGVVGGDQGHAGLSDEGEHFFAIDEVFWASEGDEIDANGFVGRWFLTLFLHGQPV